MPHLIALGTPSSSKGCDPRRTSAHGADGVTAAIDLLVGRYLHTASPGCRHVSRTLVGNESRVLPTSAAWPGSGQMPVDYPSRGRGSCWLAADLTVSGVGVESGAVLMSHRPDGGMTELPATNRAGRRAISMAGLASTDIGVAEVHDSFTPTELIGYEECGFAEPAVSAVTILEGPVADGR
jgi:hypothetical protein